MEFSKLMLLTTEPLFWHDNYHDDWLQEFLTFVLDPQKPGRAALRAPSLPARDKMEWHWGRDCLEWVETDREAGWPRRAAPIASGEGDRGTTLVFLDKARFEACLRAEQFQDWEAVPGEFYVSFSLEWWELNRSKVWAPELHVSNSWPVSNCLAPPVPEDLAEPQPMSGEKAAWLLKDCFAARVVSAFRWLRDIYDLSGRRIRIAARLSGHSELQPARPFESPVFHYAQPGRPTETSAELCAIDPCRAELDQLCGVLGTEDAKGADVTGGFLEGSLLVLRRQYHETSIKANYLVVPWWPADKAGWAVELENELWKVAHVLSRAEFSAADASRDVLGELEIPGEAMGRWRETLGASVRCTRDLQRLVVFVPPRSREKKEAFRIVRALQGVLSRLGTGIVLIADRVAAAEQNWKTWKQASRWDLQSRVSHRPLPEPRLSLEGREHWRVIDATDKTVEQAMDTASALQRTYDSVNRCEKELQEILDQERREIQEQGERNQRVLSFVVAALAAILALPIFAGQMNWEELMQAITGGPRWLARIGEILRTVHPYLAFTAIALAGLLLLFLAGVLAWAARRSATQKKTQVQQVGHKLSEAWRLVSAAWPEVDSLSLLVSETPSSGREPEPLLKLRRSIAEKDEKVCERLVDVWDWLLRHPAEPKSAAPEGDIEALRRKVRTLQITSELLDNRSFPFPLPVALCLLRYKSPDFAGSSVIGRSEFRQRLGAFGFAEMEIDAVDAWAGSLLRDIPAYKGHRQARQGDVLSALPADEFVEAIRRTVGVSALHGRMVEWPA